MAALHILLDSLFEFVSSSPPSSSSFSSFSPSSSSFSFFSPSSLFSFPSPPSPLPPSSFLPPSSSSSFFLSPANPRNPLVSTEQMRQRMQGRKMVRIPRITSRMKDGDIEGDWVTMGVVVEKLPPRYLRASTSLPHTQAIFPSLTAWE